MRGFRGESRAGMISGTRRVLGGAKHGIKFLGRANHLARRLGVNNPVLSNDVNMLERYGLSTVDFLESELPSQ
jgi:hypothetical protein